MNSKGLVNKARAGDRAAFAQLYADYKDALYRYAYFKLGSDADAQDAVSSCVTEAYRGVGTLKSKKAFGSWLFRILYRECCAILRLRMQQRGAEDIDGLQIAAEDNMALAPELQEALAILSAEEREIVLLATVAQYNSREIAEMLGLKHATVRSKLSRALAKMRSFLE